MLNSIDFNNIRNTSWYRQGGAIRLFYVFGAYFCVNETIGYDKNIMYQKGDINSAFFGRKEEATKCRWIINKQKKDKGFIDNWIIDWENKNKKLLNFCRQSFLTNPEKWSDEGLANFLSKFNKLSLSCWKKGVLCEWTDPDGDKILRQTVDSYNAQLSNEELSVLVAPEELTFVQSEFLDLVRIAKKKIIGSDTETEIQQHTRNYYWCENTWAYVRELDEKHFHRLVDEMIKNFNQFLTRARQIKQHMLMIRKQKKLLLKKRFPKELNNILYMFERIAVWRDNRKKLSVCMPNHYLFKILKQLMRVNNLSENLCGMLCYNEINGWKLSASMLSVLQRRRRGSVFFCTRDKQCKWLYGKSAKIVYQTLLQGLQREELRGVVANRGIARGVVKIIETKDDFFKMCVGDILVASMTRPEYAPLMQIAGGIITNEGGITCHAAIVSRELGKPCVIGTQVATEVLKDGDLVEVDANRGVITKL